MFWCWCPIIYVILGMKQGSLKKQAQKILVVFACLFFCFVFLTKESEVGYWDLLYLEFCIHNQFCTHNCRNYRRDFTELVLAKCSALALRWMAGRGGKPPVPWSTKHDENNWSIGNGSGTSTRSPPNPVWSPPGKAPLQKSLIQSELAKFCEYAPLYIWDWNIFDSESHATKPYLMPCSHDI